MSYILDSLKKSEKDRKDRNNSTDYVMRSPAFLANDKPSRNIYKISFISIVVILVSVIVVWLAFNNAPQTTAYKKLNTSSNGFKLDNSSSVAPEKQAFDNPQKMNSRINTQINTNIASKQEAIALYHQALANKSSPEIDKLYKEIGSDTIEIEKVNEKDSKQLDDVVNTGLQVEGRKKSLLESNDQQLGSSDDKAPVDLKLDGETIVQSTTIPSIYAIDSYIRKDIPSINYGAHIYASDNNSGFVILDGARRRAGDKLENGLYVEKIEEENVILNFNGTLFSLPAMKSWSGR